MADRYYDSNLVTGANDGTTKADAFRTIAAAAAAMAVLTQSSLWFSHLSNESLAAFVSNFGNGNKIICVDFSGSTPPVSADWTTGGVIDASGGNFDISFIGSSYYFGIQFISGDDFTFGSSRNTFKQCDIRPSSGSDNLQMVDGEVILIDSTYTGGGIDHEILMFGGRFAMYGGSILFAGTLGFLARSSGGYGQIEFHSTDLSNGGNGISKIGFCSSGRIRFIFDSCDIDPSIPSTIGGDTAQINFYGSYNGDKPYFIQEETYYGVIQSETTIIKSGGSSDGTTPISLKFTGNANNASGGMGVFLDMPIDFWVNSIGNQTFEIDLLTDGVTLTEADMIMELIYPQAGKSQKVLVSSRSFDDANLPASTVAWTTTGLGNPIKQKISMTVPIGQVGVVQARLRMVKANTIVYVDLKLLASNRQHLVGQAYINSEVLACDNAPEGKVIDGTVYDFGNLEGNYKQVPADKGQKDFQWGENGVEFTGTLETTIKGPVQLLKLPTGIKVIKI